MVFAMVILLNSSTFQLDPDPSHPEGMDGDRIFLLDINIGYLYIYIYILDISVISFAIDLDFFSMP